jgi:hypothetical protein
MSYGITENQKKIISKILLNYKRNSEIRDKHNNYIQYKIINGNYKFSFLNLESNLQYKFYIKDMQDNYKLLFTENSSENGQINSFEVNMPNCYIGESVDFILIPDKELEYYVCSIYPYPLCQQIDNKLVTLDMIFPKGLLWACYGENFEPNTTINVISYSGDEAISKKYIVDINGKFIFSIMSSNSNTIYKSKLIIIANNIKFDLYYYNGTHHIDIQNKLKL